MNLSMAFHFGQKMIGESLNESLNEGLNESLNESLNEATENFLGTVLSQLTLQDLLLFRNVKSKISSNHILLSFPPIFFYSLSFGL